MATLWTDTGFNNIVVVGTQLVSSMMGSLDMTETRLGQLTLLRTILGLDIGASVHDQGEGSQRLAIGLGIASQEAFAAGVLPDPNQDSDFPPRGWIWRAAYRVYGFAADQPAIDRQRVDMDLRSRRKLENGISYLVADNIDVEGSGGSVRIVGRIRQLWLVP